ncbi:hypothetical protein TNCV_4420131 [Trichonephila clavipes]|nr:hypothetical protein TNCV_4420131 [Trichonephila clavipes]
MIENYHSVEFSAKRRHPSAESHPSRFSERRFIDGILPTEKKTQFQHKSILFAGEREIVKKGKRVYLHWLGLAADKAFRLCAHARMDDDHLTLELSSVGLTLEDALESKYLVVHNISDLIDFFNLDPALALRGIYGLAVPTEKCIQSPAGRFETGAHMTGDTPIAKGLITYRDSYRSSIIAKDIYSRE